MTEPLKQDEWASFKIITPPAPKWEWCFGGHWFSLTFRVLDAPNWFHRLMQRLVLGIHWRRIKG